MYMFSDSKTHHYFCVYVYISSHTIKSSVSFLYWERSSTVVECLTQDRGVAGLSFTGVTGLCPWARHINACLVMVQPRKARPDITEKLLTGT